MVGALLAVGEHKVMPQDLQEAIQGRVRPPWVRCVPPSGLYFVRPMYPEFATQVVLDPFTRAKIIFADARIAC
jgi:tRNA U38,U39,U40 pseudouridine synthase TruA